MIAYLDNSPNITYSAVRKQVLRAITTGHSNRRRTQTGDFENIEIAFPPTDVEQRALIEPIIESRQELHKGSESLWSATQHFDNVIDGRGGEQLPEIELSLEEDHGDG